MKYGIIISAVHFPSGPLSDSFFVFLHSTGKSSTSKYVCFAVLSVLVRPTAAIIWILMSAWHLQQNLTTIWKVIKPYLKYG